MEKIVELLTSPVFWSSTVAFLAILAGYRQFRAKIKSENLAVKERRQANSEKEVQNDVSG